MKEGERLKNIGIIPNLEKDIDLAVTSQIVQFIEQSGCVPLLPEQVSQKLNLPNYSADVEDIFRLSNFIIVLGGDGTILSIGRNAAKFDVPLLGINLGTLGFLTDVEKTGASSSISKVLNGDYKIEKRIMLEANIINENTASESYIALNDVCVTRGVFSKIVDLHIHVNNDYVDTFRADGVIVSTPTGSTAYNLSAGGPILKPDTKMFAITPICPHALHARSIVISAEDIVTVEIGSHSRGDLLISVDGQTGSPLKIDDIIKIKRSKYYTSIIKTNDLGFYDVLRQKLVRNEG